MDNKTLIILGNGFDLDLGWKTSYADFYQARRSSFEKLSEMDYIRDMIKGEHWYDLEGYIRECIIKTPKEQIKDLNSFWIICSANLFEYFANFPPIYTTNKESCAYAFLNKVSHRSSIISFNYTNPFEKEGIKNKATDYIYMHGSLAEANHFSMLKLGVDRAVLDENIIAGDKLILPIIKSNENNNKSKILQLLKDSQNIIFYGHSLGQTDADYFKIYFQQITKGSITNKNIYFITRDAKGLQQMKNNLKTYSVEYDELALSGCSITPVYTENGIHNEIFSNVLQII